MSFLQTIRAASDGPAAKVALMSGFSLTEPQAEGVLAMTLRRLTGLEAGKLREEQQQLSAIIADLKVSNNRERRKLPSKTPSTAHIILVAVS